MWVKYANKYQRMKRVNKLITVVKNFCHKDTCNQLYLYLLDKSNHNISNENDMPWFIGNNLFYHKIDNNELKQKVYYIKWGVANLLSYIHQEKIYPHLTDLVLWKAGQSMNKHVDNGSNLENDEFLSMRKYSAIVYLNDNYKGGKTFIRLTDNEDYVQKPKTGSLIMFTGDKRCEHGVTKVIKGKRGTIAMWFTVDKNYVEKD